MAWLASEMHDRSEVPVSIGECIASAFPFIRSSAESCVHSAEADPGPIFDLTLSTPARPTFAIFYPVSRFAGETRKGDRVGRFSHSHAK